MLSHHILRNIISMNKNFREFFYHYFVTERYLNNTPYRMFSLNCNQHSKARKEHALIKCFFDKVLTISLYCKDMVKPDYIKGVQKQAFAKQVSAMNTPPPSAENFPSSNSSAVNSPEKNPPEENPTWKTSLYPFLKLFLLKIFFSS